MKRERRKQSNRESARRSRLRKQVCVYGYFLPKKERFVLPKENVAVTQLLCKREKLLSICLSV
jgi:bZIP transcription factor